MKRKNKLAVLALAMAVARVGLSQTTQPSITLQFNSQNQITSISQTLANGQVISTPVIIPTPPPPPPTTQPILTVNVPAGFPIPVGTGEWVLQPGATYTISSEIYVASLNWHLHVNGANIVVALPAPGSNLPNQGPAFFIAGANDSIDGGSIASGSQIIQGAGFSSYIAEINGTNFQFTNMTIGHVCYGLNIDAGANGVLMQHINFPWVQCYGVFDSHAQNVVIDHCNFGSAALMEGSDIDHWVRESGGTPWESATSPINTTITNCTFFNPQGAAGDKNDIDLQTLGGWDIENNVFGSPGIVSAGLWLGPLNGYSDAKDWPPISNVILKGNVVYDTFTRFLGTASNIRVEGNVFDMRTPANMPVPTGWNPQDQEAISLASQVSQVAINNNIYVTNGPGGTLVHGLTGCSNVSLNGNRVLATINLAGVAAGTTWAVSGSEAGNFWFESASALTSSTNNQWTIPSNGSAIGWFGVNGSQIAQTQAMWNSLYPTDICIPAQLPTVEPSTQP